MIRVKLSTDPFPWPLFRQTPGRSGRWGDCVFHHNEAVDECESWVVFGDVIRRTESTRCPPANTLFITPEPASVQRYPRPYLAQFAAVLGCQPDIRHRNVIRGQPVLPWHIGIRRPGDGPTECLYDYDDFKRNPPPEKTRLISVVNSDKVISEGHVRRRQFIELLKDRFRDRIDVFPAIRGRVLDKWQAIAPYRFHVAIENSNSDDYWSEKLSDAFLGWAHPLYNGAPNIGDYFPRGSLTVIDLYRPEEAVAVIERAVADDADRAAPAEFAEARRLVLDRHNLFPRLAELVKQLPGGPRETVRIRPRESFSNPVKRLLRPVVRYVRSALRPRS
jgi:hypothetical protein